jgi:arsenite oxidase small subunit
MSEKISRRNFLKTGGLVAAVATAELAVSGGVPQAKAQEGVGRIALPYPSQAVGQAKELKAGQTQNFNYPDKDSPCILLKVGKAVPGGVGPDNDLVAYSTLCSHKGCPVTFDSAASVLKCPCHYTIFDPERLGQVVCGQATVNLPQVVLEYNADSDSVTAVAINGLIYGRQANTL